MNGRSWEEFAENAGTEYAKQNLYEACDYANAERQTIGLVVGSWVRSPGKTELGNTPQGNDNETSCRSLDG